ncbi:3-phenylpropionate/trans-cinnamate dioxygenase ferredoxin reductase subunit [Crossiella equi]|uniref:3-phenylpropionate/trans-cinnamate dioxygenase ferredoxin reductase subunit n=1 Tax=Crossiella equi TaxID=130796 RepID=A0ABS5AS25_9PSEU|nr:FAD-dependent oxidoreductase [Crossiella equi]MBP2479378.1 3-phenylpropionate/trans-cinnamate dioxygenase ferredoxin reductase subunit [Crossiella equi]
MAVQQIVIVGAGLAGAKTAQALRDKGYTGSITLVGDEARRPYERPPLSKGFLQGKSPLDKAYVHEESWYAGHEVDLRLGVAVTTIDRSAREVGLADGSRLPYDKLVLATGASPRPLPGAEPGAAGVHYLRRAEDAERLKDLLGGIEGLLVVGAGWIGLEVTAAARAAGVRVTVLESLDLPLLRVLGPEIAQVFADLHTAHGVDLRLGTHLAGITPGATPSVELADGTRIEADAVLVGIGAAPNTALAEAAGLAVDNGVLVDAALRTSDPDVLAVGDVANAAHPVLGTRVRVEHWANALNQPATAAATLLGEQAEYTNLPYFYTDQFDLGMEYVGHLGPDGYDRVVVRGELDKREFIAFWLRGNRVRAAMNVNVWDVVGDLKALILSGKTVDPAALADLGTPLGGLVSQ